MYEQLISRKHGDWSFCSLNWIYNFYSNVVNPFTTGITFPGFIFCLVMKWLQRTLSEILNSRETGTKATPLCLPLMKRLQIPESWKFFLLESGRILGFGIRNLSSIGIESGIQSPWSWIGQFLCDCVLWFCVLCFNDRLFPEKYTMKVRISNTQLEKGDHYYIQTRHKDLFFH